MRRPGRAASPRRTKAGLAAGRHALIGLVSRLLIAQAGVCAAIGICYGRRNTPLLVLTIVAAIAVCSPAGNVRSGSQSAWLLALSVEATAVAVGLFRFAYPGYLGGTLLAIVSLGTLLHPQVARAIAPAPAWRRAVRDRSGLARQGIAEATGDVLPRQAVS
ncbi:MAG: hypothetical protein ACLQFR_13165 [Streptosporangiaceae bacterium]